MIAPTTPSNTGLLERIIESAAKAVQTTPGKLWFFLAAICALCVFFCFILAIQIGEMQKLVNTLGKRSNPSLIAAQRIRVSLFDMEAHAANVFLQGGNEAKDQYDRDRVKVSNALVDAAQNIAYGDAEKTPIKAINAGIGKYIEMNEDARVLGFPKGLDKLESSKDYMEDALLPSAKTLALVNSGDHLKSKSGVGIRAGEAAIMFAGGVLVAALAFLQIYFFRKFKRVLNPPLLAATLILCCFLFFAKSAFDDSDEYLQVAKKYSYQSIHDLWDVKAIARQANATESFYLLETDERKGQTQEEFNSLSAELAIGSDPESMKNAHGERDSPDLPFLTRLAKRDVFSAEGEEGLIANLLEAYTEYMKINENISKLEQSGKHKEAVELFIGTEKGHSGFAFELFNQKLEMLIELDLKEFNENVANSESKLSPLVFIGFGVGLLVAVLAVVGIAPRLKEYA